MEGRNCRHELWWYDLVITVIMSVCSFLWWVCVDYIYVNVCMDPFILLSFSPVSSHLPCNKYVVNTWHLTYRCLSYWTLKGSDASERWHPEDRWTDTCTVSRRGRGWSRLRVVLWQAQGWFFLCLYLENKHRKQKRTLLKLERLLNG